MEQANASTASSNSVGMTSTACNANVSVNVLDETITEGDKEKGEGQPTKKQKPLKSAVWIHYNRVESTTKEDSRSRGERIVENSVGGEWLGGFQEFVASGNVGENHMKSELDEYLKEGLFPMNNDMNFDILNWWKHNGPKFPILARMARDILAISTSSVASENSFSKCRRIITDTRSSLLRESVETLMCVKDWIPDMKNGNSEKIDEDGSISYDLSPAQWDLDF